MAKFTKRQQQQPREPEGPAETATETRGEPEPVVVPKVETKTENTGIGGSPLAVPPRGFFGKPPSPGGIGSGCAR